MNTSRVLIVGAGPAGATAALLLAEHGIDTLVVERRVAPSTHPAAHVLSTRTLEIFRELGLEHDVRRLSSRMYELRDIIYATSLTGPELGRITIYDPESTEAQLLQTLSPLGPRTCRNTCLGTCCGISSKRASGSSSSAAACTKITAKPPMALNFESPAQTAMASGSRQVGI